jgi:SET domain-containing protein
MDKSIVRIRYGIHGRECIATQFIPKNTIIIQEKPFFLHKARKEPFSKAIKKSIDIVPKVMHLAPEIQKQIRITKDNIDQYLDLLEKKYHTNRFEYTDDLSCLVYYGSYLNHSCCPNVKYKRVKNKLVFYTICDVDKGDELTISYINTQNDYNVRAHMLKDWDIVCTCIKCIVEQTVKTNVNTYFY